MSRVFIPPDGAESFLRRATRSGYSMESALVSPVITGLISDELEEAGQLFDYNELKPTSMFEEEGMQFSNFLFQGLNRAISGIEGRRDNHLPYFSVRVFEPGKHGTTIHRNHGTVGPWAVGVTLRGSAPFNVYDHSQLPLGRVIDLYGDGHDPAPLESMTASPGSAWTLYTRRELRPHSSGLVDSPVQRELILFYDLRAVS